jgi:hypothetical protein
VFEKYPTRLGGSQRPETFDSMGARGGGEIKNTLETYVDMKICVQMHVQDCRQEVNTLCPTASWPLTSRGRRISGIASGT